MEPKISLRRRIEILPKGPEDKALREIVIELLMLDLNILRTLHYRGNQDDYRNFKSLTEDHIAKIEHDDRLKHFDEDIRVWNYVRMLPSTTLRSIVSRPFETQYYREAIYLRIMAYRRASQYVSAVGHEPYDVSQLCQIVELSQRLYKKVQDATLSGYLEPGLDRLRILLQSIDEPIENACNETGIHNQPMVFSGNACRRYILSPILSSSRLKFLQLISKQGNIR